MVTITELFAAIKASQSELVRKLILQDKSLLTQKLKTEEAKFDVAVELDAHRFIGAYLGSLSPLHYAILVGEEQIAKDIIETTFKEDLDDTFGGQNTALHLATFLGEVEIVKILIALGASVTANNSKGFAPVDLTDNPAVQTLFVK